MLPGGDELRWSLGVECLLIAVGADMKNMLLACIFGSVLASGAAMSAERAPNPAAHKVVPTTLHSWEGLYLGANAGYELGSENILDPGASGIQTGFFLDGPAQLAAQLAGLAPLGLNTKGSIVGGQVGYNWQVGAFVWGIETDFDGTRISGSAARSSNNPVLGFPPFSVQTNLSGSQSLDTLGTFRGRIGWTPFDRNLFYATGGLAYGHASSSVADLSNRGSRRHVHVIKRIGSKDPVRMDNRWWMGMGTCGQLVDQDRISILRSRTFHYAANPIFGIAFMGPPFTLTTFNPSTEFKGSIFRAGLNWRLGDAG